MAHTCWTTLSAGCRGTVLAPGSPWIPSPSSIVPAATLTQTSPPLPYFRYTRLSGTFKSGRTAHLTASLRRAQIVLLEGEKLSPSPLATKLNIRPSICNLHLIVVHLRVTSNSKMNLIQTEVELKYILDHVNPKLCPIYIHSQMQS